MQAVQLAHDDGRGQHHRQREAELLGAPPREKPRNGRQIPCTTPIQPACGTESEPLSATLKREDTMISTPTAASADAISFAFPNRFSISKSEAPAAKACLMKACSASPTMPVRAVARITRSAMARNA